LRISTEPKVSIGIPVFNGAKTLAKTIEAAINQDYANLEIIISDNCSTDETQSIAEDFQSKDPRIKYIRQKENYGMTANFSKVFEHSTGEFFMWAAHDDQHNPAFISKCLPFLLRDPKAGLCVPKTQTFLGGEINWVSTMRTFSGITTQSALYKETLNHFPAVGLYGLYRSSVIKKTGLWKNFMGADLVFIQNLALHGSFVYCDEILFSYFERDTWNTLDQDYWNVFRIPKKPWYYSPFLVVALNQFAGIMRSNNSLNSKSKLFGVLTNFLIVQVMKKVTLKILRVLIPSNYKIKFLSNFYWRFMHNPNIDVIDISAFTEHDILPMIGLRPKV
jgi:glycosyltransferase involved in cell wall biosynthesis